MFIHWNLSVSNTKELNNPCVEPLHSSELTFNFKHETEL